MKATPKLTNVILLAGIFIFLSGGLRAENGNEKSRDSLSRLATLPYLQVKSPSSKKVGVTYYDEKSAYQGVNLCVSLCPLRAFVIDMEGNILHKWEIEVAEAWPKLKERWDDYNWRNAHLFANGDLLAICPEMGLIKVDKDSKLIWSYTGEYIAHHDLDIDGKGNIYVLTHKEIKGHPRLELAGTILTDYITVLTSQGKEKEQISIIDCFFNSDYAPLLDRMQKEGDVLHTNTLEIIDGHLAEQIPFFKKGHILIATRELDIIAIINPRERKVVWALTSLWKMQHHPTILQNGNILIFDNCGPGGRRSKVMEFNPLTQEIAWAYRGDSENKFFSMYSGSCHRLPNGNTLIIESDNGRAFEVNSTNKIVWEFINPFRGKPGEHCGSLYEVIRIQPDQYPFLNEAHNLTPAENKTRKTSK